MSAGGVDGGAGPRRYRRHRAALAAGSAGRHIAIGVGILGGLGAAVTGADRLAVHPRHRAPRRVDARRPQRVGARSVSRLMASARRQRHDPPGAAAPACWAICSRRRRPISAAIWYSATASGSTGPKPVWSRATSCPVMASADLAPDEPRRVRHDGVEVVLVRRGEKVYAVGEQCSHLCAPMSEGWLYRGDLVCPWHGSRFDLRIRRPGQRSGDRAARVLRDTDSGRPHRDSAATTCPNRL